MAAKRKSPDKFHVGQRAMLVLDSTTGHEPSNGQIVTILRQRVWGEWECGDPFSNRPAAVHSGWRYAVTHPWDLREWFVEECMLRPLDGDQASSWEAFEKATGFRPDREAVTAKAKRQRPGSEARHG